MEFVQFQRIRSGIIFEKTSHQNDVTFSHIFQQFSLISRVSQKREQSAMIAMQIATIVPSPILSPPKTTYYYLHKKNDNAPF